MADHTVTVTPGENGAQLEYSETFNVAVPFIDRHIDEGRGAKLA